jgi:hypothetical protein
LTAEAVARALGHARREGRSWRCSCPLHGGHSLVLRDGAGDRLLATCWGGCDRLDVFRSGRLMRWRPAVVRQWAENQEAAATKSA